MIDFFIKGGILMWPILLCSVMALAITLSKALQFRTVLKGLSGTPDSILHERPRLMAPLLAAMENGGDEQELSIIGSRQIRGLEKGLGLLALISVIAPLLGLTGTVTGMIQAFQIIAAHESQVNPRMLAGGIWEALITTAAGLFVAIPTHVAYHLLGERLDEIALTMKEIATRLYSGSKRWNSKEEKGAIAI